MVALGRIAWAENVVPAVETEAAANRPVNNAARAERYFQADAVVPDGLSKQPESGFPVVRRKFPAPVK